MADYISELPDSLLCHILSFLPTKTAVLTGILSNRWRLLWTSLPILDFDDDTQIQNKNQFHVGFAKFVDSVLIQREPQPIKGFHLKCTFPSCNSIKVKAWVNEAINQRVEQLELNVSPPMRIALPLTIYTCRTLVVLKLNGVFEIASLPVHLPKLKVLDIGEDFYAKNHDFIMKFLSGCPVLENLVLDSFKSLTCGCQSGRDDDVVFGISCSNLVEAKLGFFYSKRCTAAVYTLFKTLNNVRFLSISGFTCQSLKYASAKDFPAFHNLIQLEITFGTYYWEFLANLIQNSSKLEVLNIYKEPFACSNEPEPTWLNPLPIAKCVLSHLKSLSFGGYQGLECELGFVGYILKNAQVLGNMTIYCASPLEAMPKHQIMKILSTVPRKSATCQVLFY
ncbi:hypothetical protein L6164_002712 [Bauhinia variegata]|uniref:Uncharacterized protein n=1 Tax=Bauhinia variegata TaxID=167791 RepID=A0ACB9PYI0_BAUVA|nr:hypothetical protein L6164_002712 [Bauhinia variegata]